MVMACAASPTSVTRPEKFSQGRHGQSATAISCTGVSGGIERTAARIGSANADARDFISCRRDASEEGVEGEGEGSSQEMSNWTV